MIGMDGSLAVNILYTDPDGLFKRYRIQPIRVYYGRVNLSDNDLWRLEAYDFQTDSIVSFILDRINRI